MTDVAERTEAADEILDALGAEDDPVGEPPPAGETTAPPPRADRRFSALANQNRALRDELLLLKGQVNARQQPEQLPDPDDEVGTLRHHLHLTQQELSRQGQLLVRQEADRVRTQLGDQALDGLAFANAGFARQQV